MHPILNSLGLLLYDVMPASPSSAVDATVDQAKTEKLDFY